MYLQAFGWALCCSLNWYELLYVFSFAVILTSQRDLVVLLLLSFGNLATVNELWFVLTVGGVGLSAVCDCGIS